MPRLFVLSGDDVGHTHDFDSAVVLGRGKDADMRLRGASISRKHARLEPDGDGWKITDLGSANGVFVGGSRVKSGRLEDGAEFRLGDPYEVATEIKGKCERVMSEAGVL